LTYLSDQTIVSTMMPATLRFLRPALATLAFGLVGRAVAQSGSSNSPFMPATAAAVPNAAGETLEFAGVNIMRTKTFVNVFDKQAKKGRWIAVGSIDADINVLTYDPRREQIVVKVGDQQKTLTLRKSTNTFGGAPQPVAILPPAAGFALDAPSPVQAIPLPAETAPLPVVVAPNPEQPAKPLTVARQEEEARMLVSDLLEIGMAQRKAYEEKQRSGTAGQPEQPSAPAPTNPPGT
jgi:hypothetical protein